MPRNLYRRGRIWWGRVKIAGVLNRRSLRTASRTEAAAGSRNGGTDLSAQPSQASGSNAPGARRS
jgi:hypothetical protein